MAKLNDYGIRFISHGCWSDPEVEFVKSDYQTVLFNYWDVAECTDYDKVCNSEDDADLIDLVWQLKDLTPSEFSRPKIGYEWVVDNGKYEFDDTNYFNEHELSVKEDYILHNTSQALNQALSHLYDTFTGKAEIQIYRNDHGCRTLVALYDFQGSTLKDRLH